MDLTDRLSGDRSSADCMPIAIKCLHCFHLSKLHWD